jgi:hypothetical protein
MFIGADMNVNLFLLLSSFYYTVWISELIIKYIEEENHCETLA